LHASTRFSARALREYRTASDIALGSVGQVWTILIVLAVVVLLSGVQVRRRNSRLQRPDNAPIGRRGGPTDPEP
jgi:hypothetical protein